MNIKIPKTKGVTPGEIAQCERELGIKFPADYVEFVVIHDGAKPESNTFQLGTNNSSAVNRFVPVNEIVSTRKRVDGFHKDMLPIAYDDCGNFVYLNPLNWSVYFWDHEIQEADYRLAGSFGEFLSLLKPFGLDQIKLKPGQVKSVWVDPDFKPEFE